MKTVLRFIRFVSLLVVFSPASSVSQEQVFVAQTGNSGAVSKAALSPDGTLVLTAGTDNVVCLWEVESGLILHEFRGFKDGIGGVAFTPDGRSAVVASGKNSDNFEPLIKVFDVKTGFEVKRINLENAFYRFAISGDGRYLLGDSFGDSLYDLTTSKHIPNRSGYGTVLSSRMNRIAFFEDKKINIFDIDAAKTVNLIPVQFDVEKLAISSDGWLVAAVEKDAYPKFTSSIYVWDVGSGKGIFRAEFLHADSLGFSPTGKLLTVAGKADYDNSGITLYNLAKQEPPRQIKLDSSVWGIHFSSDGRYLEGKDVIIDVALGVPLPSTTGASVSFARDSKRAIFVTDGKVVVYDLPGRKSIRTLKSLGMGNITRAAVSNKDRFLALASEETLLLWDLKAGRVSSNTKGKYWIQDLAFSPDEKFLVFASAMTENDKDVVRWLDTNLNMIWGYKFEHKNLPRVAISSDGTLVAVSSGSKIYLLKTESGLVDKTIDYGLEVDALAFSPKDHLLFVGSDQSSFDEKKKAAISALNYDTGKKIKDFLTAGETWRITELSTSSSGNLIAVATNQLRSSNSPIEIFDTRTGEKKFVLTGHQDAINSLCFSRDEHFLVSSSGDSIGTKRDYSTRLWNLETSQEVRRFGAATDEVTFSAFIDGARITLASDGDQTIRIYETASGREIARLASFKNGAGAVLTDNLFDASGEPFPIVRTITIGDRVRATQLQPREELGLKKNLLPEILASVKNQEIDAAANSPDERVRIRNLIERFFAAYIARDLQGYKLVWDAGSPEARKWADTMTQVFAENGSLSLVSLQFSDLDLNADSARVLLDFEIKGVNLKTNEQSPLFGKMRRVVRLTKTEKIWKIWSYGTEQDDLAARLEAATSMAEREKLFQRESNLVNPTLVSILNERARSPYRTEGLEQSKKAIEAAVQTARRVSDFTAEASSYLTMGDLYKDEKLYEEALTPYSKALALYSANNNDKAGYVTYQLGRVYSELGRYVDSRASFEASLKFYERENNQTVANEVKPALKRTANFTIEIKPEFRLRVFCDGTQLAPFITGSNFLKLVPNRALADVLVERDGDVLRVDYSNRQPLARLLNGSQNQPPSQFVSSERGKNEDAQHRLFEALLKAWNSKFFQLILSGRQQEKPGLEIRLAEPKRTLTAGEEITVQVRNNLPDKSHFSLVVLSSDGLLDIRSADNNGPISPGINWQHLKKITLPVSSGKSVLGVLALRKEISIDDELVQPAFDLIAGHSLLGAASLSLDVQEKSERAAEELNAAVRKTQEIYGNLLMNRAGPSGLSLFEVFWSHGLPLIPYSDRQEKKRDALASIRAELGGDEKDETAVLFYSLDSPRQRKIASPDGESVATSDLELADIKAWLIGRNGIIASGSELVSVWDIRRSIRDIRQAMGVKAGQAQLIAHLRAQPIGITGTRPRMSFEDAAEAVSKIVFPGDIAAKVKTVKHLVVVPILGIGSVPFSALRPTSGALQLVETTTITVAPSLFQLSIPPADWNSQFESPLIVGDADFSLEKEFSFPRLSGTNAEAKAVAGMFRTIPLLAGDATLDAIKKKAPTADLLYFATHGVSDPDSPLEGSFLALTSTEKVKGRWTAFDIQRSRLKARLAVLSACQTGLGKEHDGGIIGLARAFTLAGVPRVAISLWSIDDKATVPLMEAFVERLRIEPPAQALRQAMLRIREKNPDPSHWASFVIFGAP